jgi:hypothetical protein
MRDMFMTHDTICLITHQERERTRERENERERERERARARVREGERETARSRARERERVLLGTILGRGCRTYQRDTITSTSPTL